MPSQAVEQIDPESLVARIIAEIQANPAAQQLLLRAMLTNEFLGMPARLDAIERDVAEIRSRLDTVEHDVAEIRIDVAALKGDSLEVRMHKWIRPFLSQKLGLRRPDIVQGAAADTDRGLQEAVYKAVDANRITARQEARVFATDLILRAQRGSDRTIVWVAVEASNTLDERDVERARESAEALQAIFEDQSTAAVMGHAIPAEPRRLADAGGVEVFLLEANR
ncbi:MAG: hypothetical protein OXQ28_13425 [Acidobacteriota bacterium]|nr:hypothetical protein [Acidobacteriota bacterium]